MSLEKTISTKSVKGKLRMLEDYMPHQMNAYYWFGELLAERLNPEVNPKGFVLAAELLLYDARRGIDGFTRKPLRSRLVDCQLAFDDIHSDIPKIAEAVCPQSFAKEVKKFYETVYTKNKPKYK